MADFQGLLSPSLRAGLARRPARWLVTGAAGFIGSNLVEALLECGQQVVGLDDFSTGHRHNLEGVRAAVGAPAWARFEFIEADVRDLAACARACEGVDYVLHQAALGSVPRSIERPLDSFDANVSGFLRILTAARDARVKRFVYASSSSVYGDSAELPKVEARIGNPLSPYAATKFADEVFAGVYARAYGLSCAGLRYVNVFGPRQDPNGAYAAVIPKWLAALLAGAPVYVNGDGLTSRDFCYVSNAVQANLLAATAPGLPSPHEVFNVAVGERTTLLQVFDAMRDLLAARWGEGERPGLHHRDFRAGDVKHSLADISKAQSLLGYAPTHRFADGLACALDWYRSSLDPQGLAAPGSR